ncbi:MAG: LLM class flavin-dependent oxidoreductase, partial [Chloroflexota bacterium]
IANASSVICARVLRSASSSKCAHSASLDVLSGGRFVLGVGLGSGRDVEWAHFEEEADLKTRAQMTDEALAILDGLWTGEPFSYEGNHYTVGESQFLPTPVQQPRIPIWIAGYYPHKAPMRRASRWDGMFILYGEADDPIVALRDSIAYVQEQRRADTPFDVVFLDMSSAGTSEEAIATLAHQAGEVGATWWLANIAPWRYGIEWEEEWDFDRMRVTVLAGPPK